MRQARSVLAGGQGIAEPWLAAAGSPEAGISAAGVEAWAAWMTRSDAVAGASVAAGAARD